MCPPSYYQEVYALLITHQVLRIAISDATLARPDIDSDRASLTVARQAARDRLIAAAGIITDTTVDLVGAIGGHVLARLLRSGWRTSCQDDADWLTPSRLATWLRSVGYTGLKDPAALHAHLTAAASPR